MLNDVVMCIDGKPIQQTEDMELVKPAELAGVGVGDLLDTKEGYQ